MNPRRHSSSVALLVLSLLAVALTAAGPAAAAEAPGTISTVAGNWTLGGPATSIGQDVDAVAVDGDTAYVAGNSLVRAIDLTTGAERTVVGAGGPGYSRDGIPAAEAGLSIPTGLLVDGAGNLLIDDLGANRVLMVAAADCAADCAYGLERTQAGHLYAVAGDGTTDGYIEGSSATKVAIQSPWGIAVDGRGDLLVSTTFGSFGVVRIVAGSDCAVDCPYGLGPMQRGHIYTAAGRYQRSFQLQDGGLATETGILPTSLTVDPEGNLLMANAVYWAGLVSMVAAHDCSSDCAYGLPTTTVGHIYTVAGADMSRPTSVTGGGSLATSQGMHRPAAIEAKPDGDLLIADPNDGVLLLRAAHDCGADCPYGLPATVAGHMYSIAGAGNDNVASGSADGTALASPDDFAPAPGGGLLIAEELGNRLRLLDGRGLTTVAGNGKEAFSGESGPADGIQLDDPLATLTDAEGNTLVLDAGNARVRVLAAADCSAHCAYGLPATVAGHVYTILGAGESLADGVAAGEAKIGGSYHSTKFFSAEGGLALDPSGNLLVADMWSNRVRMLAVEDCSSNCPYGLASTVADHVYTVAGSGAIGSAGADGGPGPSAELDGVQRIAVDPDGDLLIADAGNDRVLLLARDGCSSSCPYGLAATVAGGLYTVAGNGEAGSEGDGGAATAAQLRDPGSVAVDPAGNLLIADTDNHRLRFVAYSSCTAGCPYGRSSTVAGRIYRLAGIGLPIGAYWGVESNGDGGPAREAAMTSPHSIAADPAGDVLFVEGGVIRIITAANCSSDCAYGLPATKKNYVYTVAGTNPASMVVGDGGPALQATLWGPTGLSFDHEGNLLLAESGRGTVREVAGVPRAVSTVPATPSTPVPPSVAAPEVDRSAPATSWQRPIRFTVPVRRLTVSRRGVVVLALGVSAATSGRLRLDFRGRRQGKAVTGTAGRAAFTAGGPGPLTVRVRLRGPGRDLLRRTGHLRATVVLAAAGTVQRFGADLRQGPTGR
ncbi:MAG TPA: hypothetical protein VMF55_06945 [Solirubrobacterales bacterium]|nr:hypothetical protein [Solirubrobacterales bacterium]